MLKLIVIILVCVEIDAVPKMEHEHYLEGTHNLEYDSKAFLGDDKDSFENLSPLESKRRLGIIFDKIDTDGDGAVMEGELNVWIKMIQKKYVDNDVSRTWGRLSPHDNMLNWTYYIAETYGVNATEDVGEDYKIMMKRDFYRWGEADNNKDSLLTYQEYTAFLHPEDYLHMRNVIVEETLEDMDKDKNGKISLNEYIDDMYTVNPDEPEPEWVRLEKEHFSIDRDKNKDGEMDKDELKEWIYPDKYDPAQAESHHLILEADLNKDGKVTKEEMLQNYKLFTGSQVTDYGQELMFHEEL